MIYTKYDETGRIVSYGSGYPTLAEGQSFLEGVHPTDPEAECVRDGKIVRRDDADDIETRRAWKTLRRRRNARLDQTGWIVERSLERGEPVPEKWREYRQALRDLPQTTKDPRKPNWPTPPE